MVFLNWLVGYLIPQWPHYSHPGVIGAQLSGLEFSGNAALSALKDLH